MYTHPTGYLFVIISTQSGYDNCNSVSFLNRFETAELNDTDIGQHFGIGYDGLFMYHNYFNVNTKRYRKTMGRYHMWK